MLTNIYPLVTNLPDIAALLAISGTMLLIFVQVNSGKDLSKDRVSNKYFWFTICTVVSISLILMSIVLIDLYGGLKFYYKWTNML